MEVTKNDSPGEFIRIIIGKLAKLRKQTTRTPSSVITFRTNMIKTYELPLLNLNYQSESADRNTKLNSTIATKSNGQARLKKMNFTSSESI